ncbi:PIN domain-like protein [Exidia glandulosa HHB12029]|uniref:PIN domain-like protein n=1 Tax=Exidia glandulosa HHB12029 TaxID=1314781 RepID=A0A166MP87_EXIGL|nr:PIN domain-like protein [Exidia glandulosa HHB12029]KZV79063.1 PIN domain-like protein [Exidia glandulosa HHB12029]
MGVEGLWEILKPAAKTESLTKLAVDAFVANRNGHRGLRLGIDASIWSFHAQCAQRKNPLVENLALQVIFFRCANLLRLPLLPLFVFDGPERPHTKRGKDISTRESQLTVDIQSIVRAFGFGCHFAPGEAEAELAYLNCNGILDAVLTDDVDAFIFGARVVIRNSTLSANQSDPILNADGKADDDHVRMFTLDLFKADPIALSPAGLILIALLQGGDYDPGVKGFGIAIAQGLAKGGFGEELLAASAIEDEDERNTALSQWCESIKAELRSNSRGQLATRHPALADRIPSEFPNPEIVRAYTHPEVSNSAGNFDLSLWRQDPDVGELARLCEQYFSWGYKKAILKRFRTIIWPGATVRMLRHSALWNDELRAAEQSISFVSTLTPVQSSPLRRINVNQLLESLSKERTHASTDGLREFRAALAEDQVRLLEQLVTAKILGTRPEPEGNPYAADNEQDPSEQSSRERTKAGVATRLRMWIPAALLEHSVPEVMRTFQGSTSNRARAPRATAKGRKSAAASETSREVISPTTQHRQELPRADVGPVADNDMESSPTDDILIILSSDEEPLIVVNGVIDLT